MPLGQDRRFRAGVLAAAIPDAMRDGNPPLGVTGRKGAETPYINRAMT
jgi:hypothetical protein